MEKQLQDMAAALASLETQAAAMLKDPYHGRSPHAGPLRSRILAAKESIEHHAAWVAANPPVKEAAPAKAG